MGGATDRRLLLLDEADNVVVAIARIARGETIVLEGDRVVMSADLPIGHKLARRAIAAGEKIIKYGAPIGSATADINAGAHVHVTTSKATIRRPIISKRRQAGNGSASMMRGYLRADGRKGIRNIVVVAYLVECAHHVAREIAAPFREHDVHLIGFPGCYPNAYAETMMRRLCTHPNVGAVLLVSLGCESFNRRRLAQAVRDSGRPVQTLVIQASGGTRKSDRRGPRLRRPNSARARRDGDRPDGASELIVGTVCGGSDGTSGITANPAVGRAFDMLVEEGAACIFEETGELIGCEHIMADARDHARARRRTRGQRRQGGALLRDARLRLLRRGQRRGRPDHDRGEVDGRLREVGRRADLGSDQARRHPAARRPLSAGRGARRRSPLRLPQHQRQRRDRRADRLRQPCRAVLTGRGSVVGSAISPVIKVCANPETYRRMAEDMDVDAGRILEGAATLDEVGREIRDVVVGSAKAGARNPRNWGTRSSS